MDLPKTRRLQCRLFDVIDDYRNVIDEPVDVSLCRPTSFGMHEPTGIGFSGPGDHGHEETTRALDGKFEVSLVVFAGVQPLFINPNWNLGSAQPAHEGYYRLLFASGHWDVRPIRAGRDDLPSRLRKGRCDKTQ
jgi:hypothetical protein